MFNAKRETLNNGEIEEHRKGVATLWGTVVSRVEEPGGVFRDRSLDPGRLIVEFNSYFTDEEINEISYTCSDNFDNANQNKFVCEKLLEVAKLKDDSIRWLSACGQRWIMAQIQRTRDFVFFAKFATLVIGVFKGSFKDGRIAPASEDSPGAAIKHFKAMEQKESPPTEPIGSILKHIFHKNEMMIPVKLCSDVKGFLAHNDRSANWLVISGRAFHVSCENNLENKCVSYFADLRGNKLLVLRTQRKRRLRFENNAFV